MSATYNAATDVPVTSAGYTATGNTVNFTLNFAPEPGTELMVVKNTDLGFISGTFDNLTNGQSVALPYNGTNYNFVANYFGSSGNDLVLAWKYNRAYAWGTNSSGQLGDTTTTTRNAPVIVTNSGALYGKTIVAMAAGGTHTLALCSDGTVAAWGANVSGQLGDGTTTARNFPVAVSNTVNSALAGKFVVAIAASQNHSLALCSDGTVAAWGANGTGQLGDGSVTTRNTPVAVSNTVNSALAGKVVVAIAASSVGTFAHSIALCSDGTVASWGYNGSGQLGDNTTTTRQAPVAVNTNNGTSALYGKTVIAIAAGDSHSIALCSDGTVVAWGLNGSGQLGDNTTTQRSAAVQVNAGSGTSSLFGKTVTAVAAGLSYSLALCSDGTAHGWGLNNNGQLGDTSTTSRSNAVAVSTATALSGKTVSAIAAGSGHSVAYCTDGTIAAWGLGTSGQLGDNTATSTISPVAVNTSGLGSGERFAGLFRNSRSTHSLAIVGVPLQAPTDISLSASSVAENSASGTTVGNLSATDANTGDSVAFTLVSGSGDTDNASFTLTGSSLKTAGVFDYETQDTYSIRVRATDGSGLTYEEQLTITVTDDLTEAPTVSAASTLEDVQTTSGLVITANSSAATHYKVTGISNGTLYQNDGATEIAENDFITVAEGAAGLKFTPSTNSTNYGSFTIQSSTAANDGGLGASGPVTNSIAVTSVNDAPSFLKGADKNVLQNSGTTTVTGWATAINAGPSDESGQSVTFLVSNNNNAMFATQPAVAANGTLTFTLAADTTSTATVTVQIQDNGGTANSGSDTSAAQTFVIAVPSRYNSSLTSAGVAGVASLSLADYNADGYQDIFVGNATNGTVTFLANDQNGGFIVGTNITVGNSPQAIGLADFNGDGRRDLVAANFGDDTVSVLLGYVSVLSMGMSNAVPATVAVGDGPVALTIGDGKSFDGDFKIDVAVANYNDNTVSILMGVGNGTFTNATGSPMSVGANPSAIVSGDINKDGILDLIVACAGINEVQTYFGVGDGTFTNAAINVTVGANPLGLAIGDIDKDGYKDLAVANAGADTVTILFYNPQSGDYASSDLSVGDDPRSVVLVDMDGDAKLDLVTANYGDDTVTLRINSGARTFGNPEHHSVGPSPAAVAARIMSGSLPTVVTANSGDGSISILSSLAPVAASKIVSVQEEASVTVGLSGTGTGTLVYTLQSAPTNGALFTNSVEILPAQYPLTLEVGETNVTYQPDTNFSGVDGFTYSVNNGGVESAHATVRINVVMLNDPPTFELDTNLLVGAVSEDVTNSVVSITNFVINILPGPAGTETNQTVSFFLATTNPAFFTIRPYVTGTNRVLKFKPKPNSNGTEYVTIYARDNGGTTFGGVCTSAVQTFAITVDSVNDRPTISLIANRTVREDTSTNISFTIGDVDHSLNSLTVTATSDNTSVVPNLPANLLLGGSGASRTLLVTPLANKNGTNNISIVVDDGLLSTTRVFKVVFSPVNDAPTFSMAGSGIAIDRNSNTNVVPGWITSSSPGPAEEVSQTITYTVTTTNVSFFSVQPKIDTNGTFSVKGATNVIGTTTVKVVGKDSGNTSYGGVNSATQSFTLTLTWRSGDLLVADRGPAGIGGAVFALNTNTYGKTNFCQQTRVTTNYYDPVAVAFATNGDLIVVDYDAVPDAPNFGAVYRISQDTLARTIVSSGADFAEPVGVAVEADDTILVADSDAYGNLGAVFRVNPTTGVKTLLSSNFNQIAGIAVSTGGAIFVTDEGTSSVIQVNAVSGARTTVSSGNNLVAPVGIVVEPGSGDLIVVDKTAKKVVRVTTGGVQTVISSSTLFVEPTHVAIAPNGDFFITDGQHGATAAEKRIYRVDKTTGVATIISSGTTANAVINQPRGIVVVP